MASAFDRRMAGRALALIKGRTKTPQGRQIAAAANRVLKGQEQPGDLILLSNFTGDKRGGASAVKRFVKGVNRSVDRFADLGNAIELSALAAERGRGSVAANANLFRAAQANIEEALKSKPIRAIAKKVTDLLANDPAMGVRFMKSIGRGVRLGGALGQTFLAGLGIAEEIVEGRGALGKSISRLKDLNRNFGGDPATARRNELRTSALARSQAFFGPQQALLRKVAGMGESGALLKDYLESRIAAEVESKQKEALQTRAQARQSLEEFGAQRAALLGAAGLQAGVAPELLTQQEQEAALDAPIETFLRGAENSAAAKQYAEAEFRKLSLLDLAKLRAAGGEEAKRQEFQRDYALRSARTRMQQAVERQRTADLRIREMTPLQRREKWQREETAHAQAISYYSRHAVVEVD